MWPWELNPQPLALQSSKLPTELLSCCGLRSIKAAEYNYSLLIHLYLLRHKHTILSEVVEGWGAGISFSYYKHDSPAQLHVLSCKTKKSTAKSTSLTVWSPPNSYCIYPTNSIGVSPDSNQKGSNLLLAGLNRRSMDSGLPRWPCIFVRISFRFHHKLTKFKLTYAAPRESFGNHLVKW